MVGVIPVIYYSILLGLGLPGEWRAGVSGLGDFQKSGFPFDGRQSSMLTPETQDHIDPPPGSPCLYGVIWVMGGSKAQEGVKVRGQE